MYLKAAAPAAASFCQILPLCFVISYNLLYILLQYLVESIRIWYCAEEGAKVEESGFPFSKRKGKTEEKYGTEKF